jgi:predicted Zn-dependent protease
VFIPAETLARVRDEHELAGTLAHALAHAALRHAIPPAGPAQNTASPSIRFLFVCGWAAWHGDARQARLLVPAKLQDVQRAYELEADRFALGLMARAGYDPSALLRYVERVDSAQSDGPTDPERAARVSAIRETIPTLATAERSVSGDLAGVQERVRPALEQRRRPPSLRRPGR